KGLQCRLRLAHAALPFFFGASLQRKPLPPAEILPRNCLWRVRRHKFRIGKHGRPFSTETDEIVTVGAIAVKKNNKLFWRGAGSRFNARAIKLHGHIAFPLIITTSP